MDMPTGIKRDVHANNVNWHLLSLQNPFGEVDNTFSHISSFQIFLKPFTCHRKAFYNCFSMNMFDIENHGDCHCIALKVKPFIIHVCP